MNVQGCAESVTCCVVAVQLCLAYKNDGGRVIVVMTTREKLEMEATFRRVIPESKRLGTQFVFRQGSCLVPDDLRMVAASDAGSTIIVSDSSRYAWLEVVPLTACIAGSGKMP